MLKRQLEYFQQILQIYKFVSFHEIYMENHREEICRDQYFDPLTAFKMIDQFKHNKIVSYELFSFLELNAIESNVEECQQVLTAIDKSLTFMDYDSFLEMVLPAHVVLRNLSTTRYNSVKIDVGSFSKLSYVRQHTQQVIALFFEKEINFCRQYLWKRQEFCRNYGADVYSLLQTFFKGKKQSLKFDQFYEISRKYGVLFNPQEYKALHRRSKKYRQQSTDLIKQVQIKTEQFQSLLLINNFKTKVKYGLQQNVPLQIIMKKPQPSYKISHWKKHQQDRLIQEKQKQLEKLKNLEKRFEINMKYKYIYPESVITPSYLQQIMRQKQQDWSQAVKKMDDNELSYRYKQGNSQRIGYLK